MRCALRHYWAKYNNNLIYLNHIGIDSPDEAVEKDIVLYGGYYMYHKYKMIVLHHPGNEPRSLLHRKNRRKNKQIETKIKKDRNCIY